MAKLHKIEIYILDIDEQYGSLQDTIDHINDRLELVSLHPFNVKTVEFDWHDEHKLNHSDVRYEDYKGMFENKNSQLMCLYCKKIFVDSSRLFLHKDGKHHICFDCY